MDLANFLPLNFYDNIYYRDIKCIELSRPYETGALLAEGIKLTLDDTRGSFINYILNMRTFCSLNDETAPKKLEMSFLYSVRTATSDIFPFLISR